MALKTVRLLVFVSLVFILPPPFIPASGGRGGSGGAIRLAEAIPEPELEALVAALREKGYHLFPNAVMTSDLRLRLLDGPSFTIFAPTDSALFSMDMTSASAADYLHSLLFHVSPVRLTLSSLRSLPSPASFPSLLASSPHHLHHLSSSPSPLGPDYHNVVAVDGVDVLFPGIFYGPHVAVHGLDGILDVRQSREGSLSPHSDYDFPFPASPSPQTLEGPANSPQEYGFSWSHPEAPPSLRAPAQSPATFPEEPFPIGFGDGSYSSSQESLVRNDVEVVRSSSSSNSSETCGDADSALGVVDDGGNEESGAATPGVYEDAAEEEAEPGYLGEKRKGIFRPPAVVAPPSSFEAISISSKHPTNECPALLGAADSDARSAAAAENCKMTAAKGTGQDDTTAAEDIEISYEDAAPGGPVPRQDLPDDLL